MEIYKVTMTSHELPEEVNNKELYFQEKEIAESVIGLFMKIIKADIKCKCEVIYPLSKKETTDQIINSYKEINHR